MMLIKKRDRANNGNKIFAVQACPSCPNNRFDEMYLKLRKIRSGCLHYNFSQCNRQNTCVFIFQALGQLNIQQNLEIIYVYSHKDFQFLLSLAVSCFKKCELNFIYNDINYSTVLSNTIRLFYTQSCGDGPQSQDGKSDRFPCANSRLIMNLPSFA